MTKRVIIRFVIINMNACAKFKNGRHRPLTKKKKATNERKREQRKAIEATAVVAASCLSSNINYYEP
jgi:hypothetical protein